MKLSILTSLLLAVVVAPRLAQRFLNSSLVYSVVRYDDSMTLGGVLGRYLKSRLPTDLSKYPTSVVTLQADNCTTAQVKALVDSQTPFLIKNVVSSPDLKPILDFMGHTQQNIFPHCDERPKPKLGESPTCTNMTLYERMENLNEKVANDESRGQVARRKAQNELAQMHAGIL